MAAATAVVSRRGNDQFRGLFSDTWSVTATLNASSLADGVGETNTIAVPGVKLGDIVMNISMGVVLSGLARGHNRKSRSPEWRLGSDERAREGVSRAPGSWCDHWPQAEIDHL